MFLSLSIPEDHELVVLAYAILMGLGGWYGFKKSGSKPSLVAGVLSFAVLLVSWWQDLMWVAVGASALLSLVFFRRVSKTRKLMPSGLLLIVSAVAFVYLLIYQLSK